MPTGPESFVGAAAYREEFDRARELLFAHPGRWRVIYHYDGDGIASASSLLRAFARIEYPVQATPLLHVERNRVVELLHATHGPILFVDTGASWLDLFAEHRAPVIVLDHHRYPAPSRALPAHVALVNPLDWGVDGMSEMCAGTLAWLFTLFLDPKNWDNVPWAISGAIADRQHVGGFQGLNARLVGEARGRRLVEERMHLALQGPSLAEALASSIDPYYVGLSGNLEASRRFVSELGIDPGRAPGALGPEEESRLSTLLLQRLQAQGARPEFCAMVRRTGWSFPSLDLDGETLSNLQNATGRTGEPGVGVAMALGDRSAFDRARRAESEWRSGILKGLTRIEKGDLHPMPALQWFESPETNLAGTQAGLAMNYLVDPRRPLVVLSPGSPETKVSGRGTPWLVDQGLDLATALREAAASVGGEGGGHKVASGATIPSSARETFLTELNARVARQIPRLVGEVAA